MAEISLCSYCFSNVGLAFEAKKIGAVTASQCPSCGRDGGAKLNREACHQLLTLFFVNGSIPPEVGGFAPIYRFAEGQPTSVEFASELDPDLRLLSSATNSGLFHNGPPLWRLGYTEHYNRLRKSD